MLGVINFAHGALYMLGAYLAYQTVSWTGSFWLALLVSPDRAPPDVAHQHDQRDHRQRVRTGRSRQLGERSPAPTCRHTRLFIIVFGAAAALLFFVLERSSFGMIIRACNKDSDMASCLGINVPRVRTGVFALGASLAALGGVVSGPMFPVDTNMGFLVIINCFIVVVVGGLGNIKAIGAC